MNKYRSHNCSELRKKDVNNKAILSGWINKKRDHGNLLFIDLRDNYGITQCIIDKDNQHFNQLEKIQLETVIRIKGKVKTWFSCGTNSKHDPKSQGYKLNYSR